MTRIATLTVLLLTFGASAGLAKPLPQSHPISDHCKWAETDSRRIDWLRKLGLLWCLPVQSAGQSSGQSSSVQSQIVPVERPSTTRQKKEPKNRYFERSSGAGAASKDS